MYITAKNAMLDFKKLIMIFFYYKGRQISAHDGF